MHESLTVLSFLRHAHSWIASLDTYTHSQHLIYTYVVPAN